MCRVADPVSRRTGEEEAVTLGSGGPAPLVSAVIPTKNSPENLERVLTGLDSADWDSVEIVVVDNGSEPPVSLAEPLRGSAGTMRVDIPFNFPRLINVGVSSTKGAFVLLLNDDIEFTERSWLARLMAHAVRPDVGPVGAQLVYPDGTMQHCGMSRIPDGRFVHDLRGAAPDELVACGYDRPRAVAAVTAACLVVRRSVFDALGGLDPLFASDYNDVDFCLRAAQRGLKSVVVPTPGVVHHESSTRGVVPSERELADWIRFRTRWPADNGQPSPSSGPVLAS